jgi:hypothetical protein
MQRTKSDMDWIWGFICSTFIKVVNREMPQIKFPNDRQHTSVVCLYEGSRLLEVHIYFIGKGKIVPVVF